jgi:hypothetical protein
VVSVKLHDQGSVSSYISAISARESVASMRPTQHVRYICIAPAGPPLGSDQIIVISTYCHAQPSRLENPNVAQGPKYRCWLSVVLWGICSSTVVLAIPGLFPFATYPVDLILGQSPLLHCSDRTCHGLGLGTYPLWLAVYPSSRVLVEYRKLVRRREKSTHACEARQRYLLRVQGVQGGPAGRLLYLACEPTCHPSPVVHEATEIIMPSSDLVSRGPLIMPVRAIVPVASCASKPCPSRGERLAPLV